MRTVLILAIGLFVLPTAFARAQTCTTPRPWSDTVSDPGLMIQHALRIIRTGQASNTRCGKCSDLHVSLKENTIPILGTVSATITVRTTRTCSSDADLKKYGCAKGQTEPKIVLEFVGKGEITSSRCDENLESAAITAIKTKRPDALMSLRPPQEISSAGPNKDIPLPESKRIVDSVVRPAAAAVTDDPEIQKKIETDPQMLKAIADGNPKDISDIGKKLGLSDSQADELAKKATALNPNAGTTKNEDDPENKQKENAKNWWPAASDFNQPQHDQPNKNANNDSFSIGSLLQMLLGNLKQMFSGKDKQKESDMQKSLPFNQQPFASTSPLYMSDGLPLISDVISGRVTYVSIDFLPSALGPVMTIIAQRREVAAGQPMSVSWSTLRVLTDPPCTLSISGPAGNRKLTKSNSGTQKVETTRSMSGSVVFTLGCLSLSRQEATSSTTVTIH